jgi:NAD+ synthase (glutamine-hydrolysing)
LAVGYCTLYGDMCGGLAVISDLPKMRVYDLANYINEESGCDLIPKEIIDKEPSAELRPGQKDTDNLPPYPVLDAILQSYIEEGKSIKEIIAGGYAPQIVAKIVNLIEKNEFKRKQAAPGLKVTSRAFGQGWKMPIAQCYRDTVENKQFTMF